MPHEISLAQLAGGAVDERFRQEMQRVLDNLLDPNTDAKKARKLQLTVTLKTNENREIAQVTIDAKITLAPACGISTNLLMDRDSHGRAVGAEFTQGRLAIEESQQEVATTTEKVSYIERKQAGRV